MTGESAFDDQPLPVNLHFRDERALTVDIDAIISSGRRMRRNRKALAGSVAAVAIGVLGVSAAYLAPTSSSSAQVVSAAPSTGVSQSPNTLDEILAGGGHVTVLGSRPNAMTGSTLTAVAWRAGLGFCSGTANVTGSATSSSITCGKQLSALSPSTPTVLAPNLVTGVTDDLGGQVAIGFVSGDVAKVSLEIRGHQYDATVVTLPGSPSTGAYVLWIAPADHVTSARDFTRIVGYSGQGAAVAG